MASEKVLKQFMKDVKEAIATENTIASVLSKGLEFHSYTAECSAGNIYFKVPISIVKSKKLKDKEPASKLVKYIL